MAISEQLINKSKKCRKHSVGSKSVENHVPDFIKKMHDKNNEVLKIISKPPIQNRQNNAQETVAKNSHRFMKSQTSLPSERGRLIGGHFEENVEEKQKKYYN